MHLKMRSFACSGAPCMHVVLQWFQVATLMVATQIHAYPIDILVTMETTVSFPDSWLLRHSLAHEMHAHNRMTCDHNYKAPVGITIHRVLVNN